MGDVVVTEGVMGGQPRIDGRRMGVRQVAAWVLNGEMAPGTVSSESDLDLADVHRALAYYDDDVEEMRAPPRARRGQRGRAAAAGLVHRDGMRLLCDETVRWAIYDILAHEVARVLDELEPGFEDHPGILFLARQTASPPAVATAVRRIESPVGVDAMAGKAWPVPGAWA